MATFFKHIGFGMLVAVAGALIWSFFWTLFTSPKKELWLALLVLPLHATLITSWFTLPLGALLGWLLPRLSGLHSPFLATCIGTALGGAVGLVSAYLTDKIIWPIEFKFYASMIPFCAAVVGFWTWFVVRKTLAHG
jgi:hypothetical protein